MDRPAAGISATARAVARHPGGPARWRPASFFISELLCVDELPHRAVIDLETPLTEFAHQAAEREGPLGAALDEPEPVLAGDFARLVTAHLARPKAARL